MANVELLRRVQKQIHYLPKTWDQGSFGYRVDADGVYNYPDLRVNRTSDKYANPCGTRACVAGHALLASGYRLVGNEFYAQDGRWVEPFDEGQAVLGLNYEQASKLFGGDNQLGTVDEIINCLCEGGTPR